MNSYNLGDTVTMRATFLDQNGNPLDPGVVSLKVLTPSGVESLTPLSNPSTGVFSYDYIPQAAGVYLYRFVGSNPGQEAVASSFLVSRRSGVLAS